ncbi:MAG: histidine kinase N-terminal 7TM domain-containing protein, partial [Elusimicrobiota bacterium]
MNVFSDSLIVSAFLSLSLAFFVLAQGVQKRLNRSWFLACLGGSVWCFGLGMCVRSTDVAHAILWQKIFYSGVIVLAVAFLHFVGIFLNRSFHKAIWSALAVAVPLMMLNWMGRLALVAPAGPFNFYTVPLPPFYVYTVFFFVVICYSQWQLFLSCRAASGKRRNQILYVLVGMLISFSGGATTFPLIFGWNVFPFGIFVIPVYVLSVSYAIVRHQLMDINVIIRKTAIYSLVTGLLAGLYFAMAFTSARLIAGRSASPSFLSSGIAAAVIAFLFHPLRVRIQRFVDRFFLQETVNRERKLLELSNEILRQKSPEALTDLLMRLIEEAVHPTVAALYFRKAGGKDYERVTPPSEELDQDISESLPWVAALGAYGQPVLPSHLPQEVFPEVPVSLLEEMSRRHLAGVFPLISSGELLGFLLLGEKRSDDVYSNEDLLLLQNAVNQTTVAYERYLLNKGLQEAPQTLQKMASSFVHEIKTP